MMAYRANLETRISDGTNAFTLEDFRSDVADWLFQIKPRSVVVVLGENVAEVAGAILLLIESGMIVLLVDRDSSDDYVAGLSSKFEASYILSSAAHRVGSSVEWFPEGEVHGQLKLTQCRGSRISLGNTSLLLPTSGSTGSSKLVSISNTNIQVNASQIVDALEISREDNCLITLPLSYTYGLSMLLSHASVGSTLTLHQGSPIDRNLRETVHNGAITCLGGVPANYEIWNRLGWFDSPPSPRIRLMHQAGGHLRRDLNQKVAQHAFEYAYRFAVMYGQTEATARMTVVREEHMLSKMGSVGSPVKDGEVNIVPLDGSPGVEIDGDSEVSKETRLEGEVIFRGANVASGYAENFEDLEKDRLESDLHTGDTGYVDSDGVLFITGRLKRIAKISGIRINLDDIERLCHAYSPECAAVEINEQIVLFGVGIKPEVVVAEVLGRTQLNRRTFKVLTVGSLPRLANHKIDYQALAESRLID